MATKPSKKSTSKAPVKPRSKLAAAPPDAASTTPSAAAATTNATGNTVTTNAAAQDAAVISSADSAVFRIDQLMDAVQAPGSHPPLGDSLIFADLSPATPPLDTSALAGMLRDELRWTCDVDLVVPSGGGSVGAHSWMLKARWPKVFAELTKAGFKESDARDRGALKVPLGDGTCANAEVLGHVLRFVYTDSLELDKLPLAQMLQVHSAAFFHGLPRLSALIEHSLASRMTYMYLLIGVLLFTLLFSILRGLSFSWATLHAATLLHDKAFARTLTAPMWLFDSTPIGRILNRFGKDQDQIDELLPDALLNVLASVFIVLGTVLFIVALLPWFALVLPFVVVLYFVISRFYRYCSRELKRLDGVSRSPIYSHLGQTLTGLVSIRAYGMQDRFRDTFERYVDNNHRALLAFYTCARWLAHRLDCTAALLITAAAFVPVVMTHARTGIEPSLASVALANSFLMTGIFQWLVRTYSDTEAYMTSVERQMHYVNKLPQERSNGAAAPVGWPTEGKIEFEHVQVRYREDLDPVLNDVSFTIQPTEKVGVVGRTGAGKSSLGLSLFEMMIQTGGCIRIDGVDISSLSLSSLRSRLAVIPQDPVLFVGTIRSNLDPFGAYQEDALWAALGAVQMRKFAESQPDGLDHAVAENGDNLSIGQRQLLCVARALLRNSRVLFLDEATAAVDFDTDALIQKTIRSAFAPCTVMTIAHRLLTVVGGNKILVMDGGRLADLDTPAALIRGGGIFADLVHETGPRMEHRLTVIANEAERGVEVDHLLATSVDDLEAELPLSKPDEKHGHGHHRQHHHHHEDNSKGKEHKAAKKHQAPR